jgi:hypothetical protein
VKYESPQVDAVVQEVLRRLRAISENSNLSPASSGIETATLSWDEPIVTWAQLAPRLSGMKRVTFPRRAVVTPLVKDELKQRGIGWSFRQEALQNRSRADRTLLVWGRDERLEQDRAQLLSSQFSCEQLRVVTSLGSEPGDQEDDGRPFAAQLGPESRAIVLARRPHRCACLLNRQPSVRAAVAQNATQVLQALDELQPNVLVFDVQRQPIAGILHGIRTYLSRWRTEATSV